MKYRQARILGKGDFEQALRGLAVAGSVYAAGDAKVAI